jgi:hypothetical protein
MRLLALFRNWAMRKLIIVGIGPQATILRLRTTNILLNWFAAFVVGGFRSRQAFRVLQLCEEAPSPALDGQASLIQNGV